MSSRTRSNDGSLRDLFAAPLEDFVRARNAWAARLKEEGRTSEAAEIQRLRKPTPAVWSVNQLARRQPAKIGELVDAVEALRRAHFKEAGGVAQATERHRETLQDLLDRSKSILDTSGLRASPGILRRIANTLSGAVADPGARSELLQGRLTEERDAPGFEALAGDRKPLRPSGPKATPRPARQDLRRAQAAVREEEGRARLLERAAARQQRAAEAAAAAAERARQRLTDLDRRAAEQRRAAGRAAQAAQHARHEAERSAEKARATY